MQKTWQTGHPVQAEMRTIAEGLATRVPFANTQAIMTRLLDDFLLVDDSELEQAVYHLLVHSHNLVEEAGAAPLAAALQIKKELAGQKVVLVVSGGNIAPERLRFILERYCAN